MLNNGHAQGLLCSQESLQVVLREEGVQSNVGIKPALTACKISIIPVLTLGPLIPPLVYLGLALFLGGV